MTLSRSKQKEDKALLLPRFFFEAKKLLLQEIQARDEWVWAKSSHLWESPFPASVSSQWFFDIYLAFCTKILFLSNWEPFQSRSWFGQLFHWGASQQIVRIFRVNYQDSWCKYLWCTVLCLSITNAFPIWVQKDWIKIHEMIEDCHQLWRNIEQLERNMITHIWTPVY